MASRQLATLIATLIIGFAAVIVIGWVSDRVAQESNRDVIARLQLNLDQVRGGATALDQEGRAQVQDDSDESSDFQANLVEAVENTAVWVRPSDTCRTIRKQQGEYTDRFNEASNVFIQMINQSRLNTLSELSAILQCDYPLIP